MKKRELIALLLAERVELQGENEMLHHDLAAAEADKAALCERLAKLEDWRASLTAGDTAVAKANERRHKELHSRIDRVADLVGSRLIGITESVEGRFLSLQSEVNTMRAQSAKADEANGGLLDRLKARIVALEALAKQRGEMLADLERRQHQDDLYRAAGEGMPEAPERDLDANINTLIAELNKTGIDGLDDPVGANGITGLDSALPPSTMFAEPIAETVREMTTEQPLRFRVPVDLGKDYGVGDWVNVCPTRSLGGHRDVLGGWYLVRGLMPRGPGDSTDQVQIELPENVTVPVLAWIGSRNVLDARPTSPGRVLS